MALVNEVGQSVLQYDYPYGYTLGTNLVINTVGGKLAFVGEIWHPTVKTGTINIRKVHFRCGAITANFAGGTQVRVSLQDLSATAGPPYQPDGTQDQTYDFMTATTTLTANAWNTTGNLSADRVVDLSADSFTDANSRWVAFVMEFQAFSASDSIIISTLTDFIGAGWGLYNNALLNTGTWAIAAGRRSNIVLECDDGTFAFFIGACVFTATGTASVSSGGAIRRAGVKFKYPTTRKIDRAGLVCTIGAGADGSFVLYDSDGTTVLRSIDYDNDTVNSTTITAYEMCFEPVTITAETFYRFVMVGGATAATVSHIDVNAVGHMDGMVLGQNAFWTQHDGANWADTTTRRPQFALGVSAMDNGASGGSTTMAVGIFGQVVGPGNPTGY